MSTRRETRVTARFDVVDAQGTRYTAVESTEFLMVQSLEDNGPTPVPGMKGYRLSTGEFLNKHDERTFETLRGTRLTRV